MSLILPAPDPRNGGRLAASIEAATGRPADVTYDPQAGEWHIDTDASEAEVRSVVDAHDGTPDSDPDDEFRKAVEAATSIADLKAALLGTTGPGAEPRR